MDRIENAENNRRLQSAIFLSIIIYFVWVSFFSPPPVQPPPVTDSQPDLSAAVTAEPELSQGEPAQNIDIGSVQAKEVIQAHGEKWTTDSLDFSIYSDGGGIHNVNLRSYKELPTSASWWGWIIDGMSGSWTPYTQSESDLSILSDKGLMIEVGTGDSYRSFDYRIQQTDDGIKAIGQQSDLSVRKSYSKTDTPYVTNVTIELSNQGNQSVEDVWFGVADELDEDVGRFLEGMRPQFFADGDIETYYDLDDLSEDPEFIPGDSSWFGLGSRYFLVAAIPDKPTLFKGSTAVSFKNERFGTVVHLKESLDAGETKQIGFQLYTGPKELGRLETLSEDLAYAVDFGIFGFFSRILLFLLKIFYAGFANWGVSILLLTLFVKLIFYPMTQKGYISSRKMQAEMKKVQPELDEIKKKYKDDFLLQQQEMQRIYQENNINPLSSVSSGCLPMLVQLPVWLALYNVMLYSVEIYDSSFLYLQDLTSMDPYGILPVLYGGLMLMSQKLTPMPANMDPAQQRIMKFMPVGFALFMFTFPSGLVLYFCCNALLTSFQQWVIRNQFAKQETEATTAVSPS